MKFHKGDRITVIIIKVKKDSHIVCVDIEDRRQQTDDRTSANAASSIKKAFCSMLK
jgi:hypothetical protein